MTGHAGGPLGDDRARLGGDPRALSLLGDPRRSPPERLRPLPEGSLAGGRLEADGQRDRPPRRTRRTTQIGGAGLAERPAGHRQRQTTPTAQALHKALAALLDFARIKAALAPDDERLLAVLQDPAATLPNGR